MKICVSHHSACDCREAEFEKLRDRVNELEYILERISTLSMSQVIDYKDGMIRAKEIATEALLASRLGEDNNE